MAQDLALVVGQAEAVPQEGLPVVVAEAVLIVVVEKWTDQFLEGLADRRCHLQQVEVCLGGMH